MKGVSQLDVQTTIRKIRLIKAKRERDKITFNGWKGVLVESHLNYKRI